MSTEIFKDRSIEEFTDLLASRASVPGGGGASALCGALGIALGSMVGEFTLGKKKYADYEEDIKALMERAEILRKEAVALVDKDAEAFEPLAKAYAIPKEEPSRDEILEKCLRDAAEVPLRLFDLAVEGLDLMKEFALKGSRMIVSDAATGAVILEAALKGAAVNVKVNTRLMKDRDYASQIEAHIDGTLEEYSMNADEIFHGVYDIF